jgi:hypothetical protein
MNEIVMYSNNFVSVVKGSKLWVNFLWKPRTSKGNEIPKKSFSGE